LVMRIFVKNTFSLNFHKVIGYQLKDNFDAPAEKIETPLKTLRSFFKDVPIRYQCLLSNCKKVLKESYSANTHATSKPRREEVRALLSGDI